MEPILTALQQKQCEQATILSGTPSTVLMERAAHALVDLVTGPLLSDRLTTRLIGVLCGYGNNGGDGLAAARLLHVAGFSVFVTFVSDRGFHTEPEKSHLSPECLAQYTAALNAGVPFRMPEDTVTVWIDAVFGIGLNRPLSAPYISCFEFINKTMVPVLAADIPSGVNATTGQLSGAALRCTATLCFGNIKSGCMLYPGAEYAGTIYSDSIGMDAFSQDQSEILLMPDDKDVSSWLPRRAPDAHKGSFGRLLCICGSPGMCGAAILAAKSAYRIGAGLVEILACEVNRIPLQTALPEAVLTLYSDTDDLHDLVNSAMSRAQAVLIGCGLGQSQTAYTLLKAVLGSMTSEKSLIIDADALNILSAHPELHSSIPVQAVLTPHVKEASRLLGMTAEEVSSDLLSASRSLAERYPCTCLLKSSRSILSSCGTTHHPVLIATGSSVLAKAGSGDVLAGAVAGLCAESFSSVSNPVERSFGAALCGAYLHGKSGNLAAQTFGQSGVLASDTADCLGLARDDTSAHGLL